MTRPDAEREPVRPTPIPVRCPYCGKRMESNVEPGAAVKWRCRGCLRVVQMTVPEEKAA